jgi:hypothetical protein
MFFANIQSPVHCGGETNPWSKLAFLSRGVVVLPQVKEAGGQHNPAF